ncbi:MAG: thrombospondin type 3 repeat-containing protein [Gammaproteobacteria bacterium]
MLHAKTICAAGTLTMICAATMTLAGQNQWTVNGPEGATPVGFAASPVDSNRVYLSTRAAVHRSDDGGITWTATYPDFANGADVILTSPTDPDTVYIAHEQQGFFFSDNGGQTFVTRHDELPLGFTSTTPSMQDAAITTNGRIFVDTDGSGVWMTDDEGLTWTSRSSGLPAGDFTDLIRLSRLGVAPGDPDRLIAFARDVGTFFSSDGGVNWTQSVSGPSGSNSRIDLAFDPFDPLHAILLSGSLFETFDGGETWSLAAGTSAISFPAQIEFDAAEQGRFFVSSGFDANARVFSRPGPGQPFVEEHQLGPRERSSFRSLYAAPSGIVFTGSLAGASLRDGDGNWTRTSADILGNDPVFLAASATAEGRVFASTFNNVRRSEDGGDTFLPASEATQNQLRVTSGITAGLLDPASDTLYAASSATDFRRSQDNGLTWQMQGFGSPAGYLVELAIAQTSPPTFYAGTVTGAFLRSTDEGANWEIRNSPSNRPFSALAVKPDDADVVLMSTLENKIWRSADGGDNWTDVTPEFASSSGSFLVFDPHNTNVVFAGSQSSGITLLRSEDSGQTWQDFPINGTSFAGRVISLAFSATQPGLILAGGNSEPPMLRSADNGASWEALTDREAATLDGAFSFSPQSIALDPLAPHRMYAGVRAGLAVYEATRDIGASVSVPATPILLTDTVEYSVLFENQGEGQIWDAEADITIAPGAELVGNPPMNCTPIESGLRCALGNSPLNTTINFTLRASDLGPINVSVATSSLDPDPVPENSTFTDSTVVVVEADVDDDGVMDRSDNCLYIANPDQRDSNGDGYGNLCDGDLNNDNVTNVVDLGLMRAAFFTADADADLNGDDVVNVVDLGLLRTLFFAAPGPAGQDLSDIN